MTYLMLFLEFFKIGLFAIGGGLATLPFLVDLSVRRPEWLTMQDISAMVAVSESTPGPMGINMATYVGNGVGLAEGGNALFGVLGGSIATIGLVLPSLIIIMVIAGILQRFKEAKVVKWAFYGLRAVVIALIASAAVSVYEVSIFRGGEIRIVECAAFLLLLFLMRRFKKVHPVVWILVAAIFGLIMPLFGYPLC